VHAVRMKARFLVAAALSIALAGCGASPSGPAGTRVRPRPSRARRTAESGIFSLYVRPGTGVRLRMTPVVIPASRMGLEYPVDAVRDRILSRVAELSAARGTAVTTVDGLASIEVPRR
jgi:hypothetical protein